MLSLFKHRTTYTWPNKAHSQARARLPASHIVRLWRKKQKKREKKNPMKMRNQQAFMEKNVYKYGNGLKAHFVSANTEYIYIVTMRWSHKVWHCSFPFKHCLCTPNQMEMQLKPVHSEQPEEDEKRWKSLFFFCCVQNVRATAHTWN